MMNSRILFFVILAGLFTAGCNQSSNPVGPYNPVVWTLQQMQVLRVPGVCASGEVLIAGAYRNFTSSVFICRSTDNGSTWQVTDSISVSNHSPDQNLWGIPSISFLVQGSLILVGIGGGMERGDILISSDGGLSWSDNGVYWPESGNNLTENINCFCALGSYFFAGTNNGVFLSSDNGKSWTAAKSGPPYQVMRLATMGPYLFAGTTGEGIYISSDYGASWTTVTGASVKDIYGLASIGSILFAGESFREGAFRSTDMGASWTPIDSGLTNLSINTLVSSRTSLYAGTNAGAFLSTNQGSEWNFISSGLPTDSNAVLSIAINSSSLVLGTSSGTIIYPLSNLSPANIDTLSMFHKRMGE